MVLICGDYHGRIMHSETMNPDDLLTPVVIEPADQHVQTETAEAAPRRCAFGILIGILVFTLGLLGGGIAAKKHTETQHAAIMSAPSMAYLSALTAHIDENADYCTNLTARSHGAATRVRLPGPLFSKPVEALLITAMSLPTGSVRHVTTAEPAKTLAQGLALNDIMLARDQSTGIKFMPFVPSRNAPAVMVDLSCGACTQSENGLDLTEEAQAAPANINATCASYLRLVARDALSCTCCSLFSGSTTPDCDNANFAVESPDAVCARVPFTPQQAADAQNARNDQILARSDTYELGDLEALAAAAFPSEVEIHAEWLSPSSAKLVSDAVQNVLNAAGKAHASFLSTTIHALWSDSTEIASAESLDDQKLRDPSSLEDVVAQLIDIRNIAAFRADSPGKRWPVELLAADAAFDETENALFLSPSVLASTTLLPPFGAGIAAGAAVRLILPYIAYPAEVHSCDGGSQDDVAAQLISGAYAGIQRRFSSKSAYNSMQIGTVRWNAAELFFLAAASASQTTPSGSVFNAHTGCRTPEGAGCEF